MLALTLVAICIIFGAFGQISMKNGMSQIETINSASQLTNGSTVINMFSNLYVVVGLLLYMISAFLWLGALSSLNVSYIYPLLSLGYVITALFATIFLHEYISLTRWGGIFTIVIGCILILKT
ncbi:MAG: hypothetical protein M8350_07765 [Methanosarcinaceae archaeon]|nr:hypothetical protein [Methanosarcinaceae archaeon]